jgi:hypothetical protein
MNGFFAGISQLRAVLVAKVYTLIKHTKVLLLWAARKLWTWTAVAWIVPILWTFGGTLLSGVLSESVPSHLEFLQAECLFVGGSIILIIRVWASAWTDASLTIGHRVAILACTTVLGVVLTAAGIAYLGGKAPSDLAMSQRELLRSAERHPLPPTLPSPEPDRKPIRVVRPDVTIRLVYPSSVAVLIVNLSSVIARQPKYWSAVWDIDRSNFQDPLPLPAFQGDWIRPHEAMGPESFIALPQVQSAIKKGDRLFGMIAITCPECLKTRYFWLYVVQGASGWYTPLHDGESPNLSAMLRALPQIQKDPEAFFSDVPIKERIAVAQY